MKPINATKLLRPLTMLAAFLAGLFAWMDGSMLGAIMAFAAMALAWIRPDHAESDN